MQPGFEKTVAPKSLPDDGNRYIFPVGSPAPGSNFAPSSVPQSTAEDFVNNPSVYQAVEGAINESSQPIDQSQVVTRQPLERQVAGASQPQGAGYSPESLIMSGLKQGQDSAAQAFEATDSLMAKFEQDQAARKQREEEALAEVRKKIDETDNEVKNFKWDNRSVWEKSSTGQRIALAIGGFLSSLSQSSAETFQKVIESSLQKDLQQQKESYKALKEKGASAQSYYGQLLNKFGSEQAADNFMMNAKMQMIQNKLRSTADTAQSKIVAANALKGIELTDAQMGKYKAEATKLAVEQQANKIPGYENTIADKSKRAKFEESLAQKKTLDMTLNDLDSLVSGSGEAIPFTEKSDRASQLVQDAQLQMKEIKKLGVLSGDDAKRLDDYISNPSLFKSDARMKAQIKGMKDLANKAIKAQESVLGLKPIGSQIGRLK